MMVTCEETWTWRPDPSAPSLPMRQYRDLNPGEGVGGAAIHWTAQLWCLPTDSSIGRTTLRGTAGRKQKGALVQDWPLNTDEMEPYYDAFEYDIGASGQVGNLMGAPSLAERVRRPAVRAIPVTHPSGGLTDVREGDRRLGVAASRAGDRRPPEAADPARSLFQVVAAAVEPGGRCCCLGEGTAAVI